ncbi:MAG: hypothetical protein J7619_18575 [Dyadobacter sp.]|uniref:immunoglobulin domain-containing protein n=1 Tax=Dyadobacter sp. TaxID=1914288 RepID=UPI001B15FBC9|nr:hypothetical protein [Dyadobacter sp.]MBO9614713.1 hypothetical protein [Dyadobacter sp.]
MTKLYLKLLLALACCGGFVPYCAAQPSNAVYPDKQTNGGTAAGGGLTGSYSVANPDNARNTTGNFKPNNNYALLTATSTLGTSSAWIQLEFPAEATASAGAPVTVYVRTNNNTSALLGGGVELTAHDKNGVQVSVQSTDFKTYYTPDGSVFLAITPTATFKYIRTKLSSPVALGTNTLQVYYAFYGPGATNTSNPYPFNVADCGSPNVSTKDYSGLTLGSFDVQNAGNAIDNDLNSKSSFVSTGVALLSGHIKQTFFFNGVSNNADAVRVILSQSGSFLAVNLASGITLQAYNGSTPVGTSTLVNTLLDADLLGLLGGNNNQVAFHFAPRNAGGASVIFDRIELDLNISALGVGLGSNGLNIHDVRRSPDVPTATGPNACSNIGTAALSALAPQLGISGIGSFSYAWYTTAHGTGSVSTTQNWTASGLNTPGTASYYVDITKSGSGCIASPRKKVDIVVSSPPVSPGVALNP